MSGVGLEVLLEGLITEIAYAGEKGQFAPSYTIMTYLVMDSSSLK